MGLSASKPDHEGVALMRIADLIEEKRRRAYAQADLQVA